MSPNSAILVLRKACEKLYWFDRENSNLNIYSNSKIFRINRVRLKRAGDGWIIEEFSFSLNRESEKIMLFRSPPHLTTWQ